MSEEPTSVEAARRELAAGLADLDDAVRALRERPLLSAEEQQQLEEQAESGELGEDMRTLVGKIKDGETTWDDVFAGRSAHSSLLQSHLTAMVEEHGDDIALAFEDLLDEEEAEGRFW